MTYISFFPTCQRNLCKIKQIILIFVFLTDIYWILCFTSCSWSCSLTESLSLLTEKYKVRSISQKMPSLSARLTWEEAGVLRLTSLCHVEAGGQHRVHRLTSALTSGVSEATDTHWPGVSSLSRGVEVSVQRVAAHRPYWDGEGQYWDENESV